MPQVSRSLRLLDELEVIALAQKTGLPREVWGSEKARMDLARFAHEAAVTVASETQTTNAAPQQVKAADRTSVSAPDSAVAAPAWVRVDEVDDTDCRVYRFNKAVYFAVPGPKYYRFELPAFPAPEGK